MAELDAPGREIAADAGQQHHHLGRERRARWKEAAQPVIERWIADMDGAGIDGQALIDEAKALIENGGRQLIGSLRAAAL